MQTERNPGTQRAIYWSGGRLYFTRRFEKTLFFLLSLGMLGWGLLMKLGIL